MRNIRSHLTTIVAVGAAAIGGAAIANAATSSSSTSSSGSTSASATTSSPPRNMPAHGSAAHEGAEKPVTGTAATKAKAAAVKAAGGGTATEVTTDYTQDGYEVTVVKNGNSSEIHLDSSFNVMQGGPGGHDPVDTPDAAGSAAG